MQGTKTANREEGWGRQESLEERINLWAEGKDMQTDRKMDSKRVEERLVSRYEGRQTGTETGRDAYVSRQTGKQTCVAADREIN